MGKFKEASVTRQGELLDLCWSCDGDLGRIDCYISTNSDSDFQPEQGQLLWSIQRGYVVDTDNHYIYHESALDQRPYFLLVAENGDSLRTAERVLPLEGVVNFRDLGGYVTSDGRRVKWGKLLRSGAHDDLTEQDQVYLKNLGLKTVVDYRSSLEVDQRPDVKMAGVDYFNIRPLEEAGVTNVLGVKDMQMNTVQDAVNALTEMNRQFMRSPYALNAYRQLMLNILDEQRLPLVQHCTAGKDRVGVGSATILLALGVPEETIIADYLLSNNHQVKREKLDMVNAEQLTPEKIAMFQALTQVQEAYLLGMFDELKKQFGDVDHYLTDGLGLTSEQIDQLRAKFLE